MSCSGASPMGRIPTQCQSNLIMDEKKRAGLMCFRTANIERGVCRARPGHYYCGSAFKIAEDVLAGKLVLTSSFKSNWTGESFGHHNGKKMGLCHVVIFPLLYFCLIVLHWHWLTIVFSVAFESGGILSIGGKWFWIMGNGLSDVAAKSESANG